MWFPKATKSRQVLTLGFSILLLMTFTMPTSAHDGEPYVTENQWQGFLACGAMALSAYSSTCLIYDDINDSSHDIAVGPELETVVMALDWRPNGGISSDQFLLEVRDADNDLLGSASGLPPLQLRFDDVSSSTDELTVRVFPEADLAGVGYQQEFTLYWDEFYVDPAPEGHSPLPHH